MQYLKSTLTSESEDNIHVLFGQANCGKTRLIKEYLKNDKDSPKIYIDLRTIQLRSTKDLLERIERELQTFSVFAKDAGKGIMKGAISSLGVLMHLPGIAKELNELVESKSSTIEKLERLLITYSKKRVEGGPPFLVVLDDVNSLKDVLMDKNVESVKDAKSLFRLLVDATKQEGICKVLLGTTDSSLLVWMKDLGFEQGWFMGSSMGNIHSLN
jgi:AAA+ ATPase superfamily predicted ATPase